MVSFTSQKLDQIGEKEFDFLEESLSDDEQPQVPVYRRGRNTYIGEEEKKELLQ